MDRTKLVKQIEASDLAPAETDLLLRRLKIASSEGVAAVVRDFEYSVKINRCRKLQSHRRYFQGLAPSPQTKIGVTLNIA